MLRGRPLTNRERRMLHHAVLHHSFTGTSTLDPDLYHAITFVRCVASVGALPHARR